MRKIYDKILLGGRTALLVTDPDAGTAVCSSCCFHIDQACKRPVDVDDCSRVSLTAFYVWDEVKVDGPWTLMLSLIEAHRDRVFSIRFPAPTRVEIRLGDLAYVFDARFVKSLESEITTALLEMQRKLG